MNRRAANGDGPKRSDHDEGSVTSKAQKGKFLQPLLSHQRNVTGARLKDFGGAKSGATRGSNHGNLDMPQNLFIAAAPNTDTNWNCSHDLTGSVSNVILNSFEKLGDRK